LVAKEVVQTRKMKREEEEEKHATVRGKRVTAEEQRVRTQKTE
jgi:hypothetical protein